MTSLIRVTPRRRVIQVAAVLASVLVVAAIYISSEFVFSNATHVPMVRTAVSDVISTVPRAFLCGMSDTDSAILNDILRQFTETADNANLTYMMYWGTLIGAYRHHGRVPWDDEADLLLPVSEKKRLLAAVAPLSPRYAIDRSTQYRWKFYAANSTSIKHYSWKFPFIDLSFYLEDNVSLWDLDPAFRKRNTYLKSNVFPLCRRPFSPFVLPAPRNTLVFLKQQFDIADCVSSSYSHSSESHMAAAGQMTVPCRKLWDVLPFVFRTKTSQGTNETLRIGSRIINWKTIAGCVS